MESRIVHAAAVDAVAAWTARALRTFAPSPSPLATTVEHATASTLATQWIHDGLSRIQQHHHQQQHHHHHHHHQQQQQQQQPHQHHQDQLQIHYNDVCHSAAATAAVQWIQGVAHIKQQLNATTTTAFDERDETLETLVATIRCAAESVASVTIQHVLEHVLEVKTDATPVRRDDRDIVESNALADNNLAATDTPPVDTEAPADPEVPLLRLVPRLPIPETSLARSESRSLVASQFVTNLLTNAVNHHHNDVTPTSAPPQLSPSEPTVLTPGRALDTEAVDWLPEPGSPPTQPSSTPPVVLAAVKPPKQTHRRPPRKPVASTAATSPSPSPRLAPVEPSKHPPKTAEHTVLLPIDSRAPRTSPRPASHNNHESSSSPPRLRKLEEYLELHPIDRAKMAYRPHRPPRHHHQTQTKQPHDASGYDAEGSDNEDEIPLPRVKVAPLRNAPNANHQHPQLPSSVVTAPAVVDRPDRLGLLNKPKKRSGFCQQCGFEGRSCKISDCLKHQLLR